MAYALGLGVVAGSAVFAWLPASQATALCAWLAAALVVARGGLRVWPADRSVGAQVRAAMVAFACGASVAASTAQPPWPTRFGPPQLYAFVIDGPVSRRRAIGEPVVVSAHARLLGKANVGEGPASSKPFVGLGLGLGLLPNHAPQEAPHRGASAWQHEQGSFVLRVREDVVIARGDLLWARLQLFPLPLARSPWAEAEATLGRRQNISARARLEGPLVRRVRGRGLLAWCDRRRLALGRALDATLCAQAAAITKALALGDSSSLPAAERNAWADAGIAHLLAVSGLHVSLVGRLAGLGTGALWRLCPRTLVPLWPLRLTQLATLLPVWGYALIAGLGTSVVRAATMATAAALLASLGSQQRQAGALLALAAVVVVLGDGLACTRPSALLSFASVAALCSLSWPAAGPGPRWRRYGAGLLAALWSGAVATLLTWPITAAFFGRVSLIAPASNLLAIPLATLLATPLALLFTLGLATGVPAAVLAPARLGLEASLALLGAIARAGSAPSWAAQTASAWSLPAIVLLSLSAVAGAVWLRQRRELPALRRVGRRSWWAFGAAAGGLLVWLWWPQSLLPRGDVLRLWHLDVGQGESALLEMPGGEFVLIDGGGASYHGAPDPGRLVVAPALRARGVRKLDLVILTHPHPDHLHGLEHVLMSWPVGRFVYNEDAMGHPLTRRLAERVRQGGGTAGLAAEHYQFGEVSLRLFAPLAAAAKASQNDRSLVTLVRYRRQSWLCTGDIERPAEHSLLTLLAPYAPIDLLQVPHHGSKTSSHAQFIELLRPTHAIVSCGESNRYGFPHAEVLTGLRRVGARVFTTAEHGTIEAATDGQLLTLRCGPGEPCPLAPAAKAPE